jgi:hypothetical protein
MSLYVKAQKTGQTVFETAIKQFVKENIKFTKRGEQVKPHQSIILHSHIGANGQRSPSCATLSKLGVPIIAQHGHSKEIYGKVWRGGAMQDTDESGYATKPSSWTRTHVIEYTGGTRCLITEKKGKYF